MVGRSQPSSNPRNGSMKIVAYNTHQEQGSAWRGTTPAKARPTMSIYVARRCQGEAVWNRLITMRWYITAAITSTKTIKILSNIQKPGWPYLLTADDAPHERPS